MLATKENRYRKVYNNGFSLVEIVVVVAIIGILTLIATPFLINHAKKANKEVCSVNCLHLERMYHTYLELENIQHTEAVFNEFLKEYGKNICPSHGVITYVDGKIQCSFHIRDDGSGTDEGDVPFL